MVARRVHFPKVAGSNPASATRFIYRLDCITCVGNPRKSRECSKTPQPPRLGGFVLCNIICIILCPPILNKIQ